MKITKNKRAMTRLTTVISCLCLVAMLNIVVFAEGNVLSLEDLTGMSTTTNESDAVSSTDVNINNESAAQAESNTVDKVSDNSAEQTTDNNGTVSGGSDSIKVEKVDSDPYNKLAEASKVNLDDEKAKGITNGIKNIVGIVINVLCFIIMIGMTLRVVVDLVYITLPFSRGLIGGGSASAGAGAGSMGMSGGLGMNGGGTNGGFGAPGINGWMNTGMGMSRGTTSGGIRGIQWVSEAALNAVSSAGVDQNGRNKSALSIYKNDMIVLLVAVPILLILATSGVLTSFGFKLGELVANIITKIGTGI